MAFASPVNTINDLRTQLNLLASAKGGTSVECRQEAKRNYDAIKAARRGSCTWTQLIIGCTVERADPDPSPTHRSFPHRCGHVGVLVDAQEGANSKCFILDDTVLQWDLPREASHQLSSARRGFWDYYLTNLHPRAMPMRPSLNTTAGPPASAQHILAEGPDRNMAFNDWGRKIALHSFATSIGNMHVFNVSDSDSMIP